MFHMVDIIPRWTCGNREFHHGGKPAIYGQELWRGDSFCHQGARNQTEWGAELNVHLYIKPILEHSEITKTSKIPAVAESKPLQKRTDGRQRHIDKGNAKHPNSGNTGNCLRASTILHSGFVDAFHTGPTHWKVVRNMPKYLRRTQDPGLKWGGAQVR